MVDKNDVEVQIKLNYENNEKSIKLQEELPLDKLKDKAIELFGIPKDKKKYLTISYYDNEQDLNQLEENESIFDLAEEKTNNLYYVELFVENDLNESRRTQNTIKSYESNKNDDSETNNKYIKINEELNIELENIKKENEKLTNTIGNYEKKILILENELKNNKNENIQLKKLMDNKEREIHLLKNEIYNVNSAMKNQNQNEMEMIIKENEILKKKIEEMNKLRIKDLEREIEEVKKRKAEKKKLKEEKKYMDLEISHNKEIENLKKIKDNLKINYHINNILKEIQNNVINLIEQKLTKKDINFNDSIKNTEKQLLESINKIIDEQKKQIIELNSQDLNNYKLKIESNFKEIKEQIEIIEKEIKKFKENVSTKTLTIKTSNNMIKARINNNSNQKKDINQGKNIDNNVEQQIYCKKRSTDSDNKIINNNSSNNNTNEKENKKNSFKNYIINFFKSNKDYDDNDKKIIQKNLSDLKKLGVEDPFKEIVSGIYYKIINKNEIIDKKYNMILKDFGKNNSENKKNEMNNINHKIQDGKKQNNDLMLNKYKMKSSTQIKNKSNNYNNNFENNGLNNNNQYSKNRNSNYNIGDNNNNYINYPNFYNCRNNNIYGNFYQKKNK